MSDLDLLVARLVAGGVSRVYKFGAVPASPAYPYAVLSPAIGAPEVRMLAGPGKPLGRFSVQMFGRSVDTVTTLADQAFAAFEGRELSDMDGAPVAWQEISTPPYRDPDTSGVLNITHTFRF